jgi:hypothetical protein
VGNPESFKNIFNGFLRRATPNAPEIDVIDTPIPWQTPCFGSRGHSTSSDMPHHYSIRTHNSSLKTSKMNLLSILLLVATSSLRTSAEIGDGVPGGFSSTSTLWKSDPDQLLQLVALKEANRDDSIPMVRARFSKL